MQRLETRITLIRTELDQFPAPVKEPNYVVMKSIEQFVLCLSRHINADSDDNPFRMQFDSLLSVFGQQLRASRLKVDMTETGERCDDEGSKSSQQQNKTSGTKRKKRGNEPASCKRVKYSPSKAPVEKATHGLADLQNRYDRGATNSIPGSINDRVTESLIRDSCAEWTEHVKGLFTDIGGLVRRMIKDSTEEALPEWKHTKFYDAIQQSTLSHFNKMITTEGEGINQQLARMLACPTTLNDTLIEHQKAHLRDLLKLRYPREWALHLRATSGVPNPTNAPLKQLYSESIELDAKWVNERLAGDKYDQMVTCLAKIHAFHDILSTNLTDTASMQLKFDVLRKFRDEAAERLRAELKVLDKAHCTALLAEDPAREKRRKQLLDEKAKLEEALAVIVDLEDAE